MSHVSFSAASGSHVNLGTLGGERLSGAVEPHHWWRALWSRRDGRVSEIRRLMQAQVAALPDAARHAALATQIAEADDPDALWSLRHALTHALVEVHGELIARRRMTDITFMFAGLLDRERHARPPGLADAARGTDWSTGTNVRGLVRNAEQALTDH